MDENAQIAKLKAIAKLKSKDLENSLQDIEELLTHITFILDNTHLPEKTLAKKINITVSSLRRRKLNYHLWQINELRAVIAFLKNQ